MSVPASLVPLFNACITIGNASVEHDGFVPIRKLLSRFQTALKLRPLLVEGMIASTSPAAGGSTASSQWVVLVDSERYPITDQDIHSETTERPLPARFRFTVAHELAHSLAFRPTEFGLELVHVSEDRATRAALVRTIEDETDRMAPLLLCSEQTLASSLQGLSGPLDIRFLTLLRRNFGVSRYVLLNRLAVSRLMDFSGLWQRPHVRDMGIVIGERVEGGGAVLRRWPLFANFTRGIVPRPFALLRTQDRLPLGIAFGDDAAHSLLGGREQTVELEAGTAALPDAERMTLEISFEQNSRDPGTRFLVLFRNQQVHAAVNDFEHIKSLRQVR